MRFCFTVTAWKMVSDDTIRKINHDLLGPIFYRFCYKLYLGQRCQPAGDSSVLFLSRGGIRLRAFYEAFLNVNRLESPRPYDDFYVSRMAAIKVNFVEHYGLVVDDFLREYAYFSVDDTLKAFLQPNEYSAWRSCDSDFDSAQRLDRPLMDQVLWGVSAASQYLRKVLQGERDNYLRYLDEVLGGHRHVMVVDTGWSGSILRYMQAADPGREYTALLFGRYNYGNASPPWFAQVVGVEVQHMDFDPAMPITSIFLNRHVIEGACEIRWPSVTGYRIGGRNSVESHEGAAPADRILPDDSEPHACGILAYIREGRSGLNFELIDCSADRAAKKLCRRLMYPRKMDVLALSMEARSADFGKNINVPYFVQYTHTGLTFREKLKRSRKSLWPAGQLALDFPVFRILAQYIYHKRSACFFRQLIR